MEFKSKAHESAYQNVKTWVRELFGETAIAMEEYPVFLFQKGTAKVQVVVASWGDDDAVIHSRAFMVKGAEMTPNLMEYLLRLNDNMVFGAFGVSDDDEIYFEHSLGASGCSKETFKRSVLAVAYTADKYDDEIVSQFGGSRMSDD